LPVAGEIVTRSITAHVTQAMAEHYSHVGSEEKLAAAGKLVQLVSKSAASSGGQGGGSEEGREGHPHWVFVMFVELNGIEPSAS
jgi:hypothetical protein